MFLVVGEAILKDYMKVMMHNNLVYQVPATQDQEAKA